MTPVRSDSRRPLAAKEVHEIASRVLGVDAKQARVDVVPSFEQLPDAVRKASEAEGVRAGDINGVHFKGHSYILADQMRSAADVREMVFHELYTHGGLRAKYGRRLGDKLDHLIGHLGGVEGVRRIAHEQRIDLSEYERALADHPRMSERDKRLVLMEELLAHMSQATGSLRRTIEEWLGTLRDWLRHHRLAELADYNAADLALVLKQARQAARESRGLPANKPMFQRVFHGTPHRGIEDHLNNDVTPYYSRRQATRDEYERRIDELFKTGKPNARGVRVLDRSDVLGMLDGNEGPLNIVEKKALNSTINHALTPADWKKVPEWVDNPVGVFASETVPGRLVAIAPELKDGFPIRMVLEPHADATEVNLLVNAYDKRSRSPMERWIQDGLLRYVDKKEARRWLRRSGLRLPGLLNPPKGQNERVLTASDLFKYRDAHPFDDTGPRFSRRADAGAQTDTPEFRRWFGASKAVDAQGHPLTLYHGTGEDFHAFDNDRLGANTGHMTSPLGHFLTEDRRSAKGMDNLREALKDVDPGDVRTRAKDWVRGTLSDLPRPLPRARLHSCAATSLRACQLRCHATPRRTGHARTTVHQRLPARRHPRNRRLGRCRGPVHRLPQARRRDLHQCIGQQRAQ